MMAQGSEDAFRPVLGAKVEHARKKRLLSEWGIVEEGGVKVGISWPSEWAIDGCSRGGGSYISELSIWGRR